MYPSSDRPLRETDFDANGEIYGGYFGGAWTKVYNEKMCEFYARQGGARWTVVRHSNIYGPYDKYDLERSHVFGATVTKVLTAPAGEPIAVWGDGSQGRDLLHVDDLKTFVVTALGRQASPFEIFNAGCGHAICIKDLVEKIIQHSGRDLAIKFDRNKPTVNTSLCLDCSKAQRKLGWVPQVSLDEGIRQTLAWYRAQQTLMVG
jgi:nucleoside-diphosphate-sugar epimerase